MIDRTEAEVMQKWPTGGDAPLVSICCTTFNHARYLADALDGFLRQETTFPFEVLAHDDASTDGSADILRAYADKYPRLIKPVIQAENQFSRGRRPLAEFLFPRAAGEYIAVCEGDDFWTTPDKLERQLRALERHPGVDLAFHPASFLTPAGTTTVGCDRGPLERIIPLADVIIGRGEFMPTASLMVRRKVVAALPPWFTSAPVGDYFLQILGSCNGALYQPEVMCCYRVEAAGSWSAGQRRWNAEQLSDFFCRMDRSLECVGQHLPPDGLDALPVARSGHQATAAFMLYAMGDRERFVRHIESSWSLRKFTDLRQGIYFALRRVPPLLDLMRPMLRRLELRSQ